MHETGTARSFKKSRSLVSLLVGRNHPYVPFAVYGPTAALLFLLALTSGRITPAAGVGLFLFGIFVWTAVEYFLHRFSFHATGGPAWLRSISSGLHQLHHKMPDDPSYVVAPLAFTIPIFAFWLGMFRLASGSAPFAELLAAGLATGYLFYEWVHYSAHQRPVKGTVARYLKKYHMIHHFKDGGNGFGVTSPLWDLVFGTRP